uniref:uncharacterized protein LOC114670992 n=1 Tax=Macaca mulatta TaxID=9544 RepID=UPI0010A21D66|nr:uncharacterized protein LOC114670992 [Macaca mulatta]XP_028685976.1 uncharacterized protein LOC114670992 [Macaca mulatta]
MELHGWRKRSAKTRALHPHSPAKSWGGGKQGTRPVRHIPPGTGPASVPREVQVGDRVRGAPQYLPIQRPRPIPKINSAFSASPHPAPREATPRMPSLPSLTCAGEGANHRAQSAAPAVTASSQLIESLAPVAVCARRAASPGVLLTAAPAPAAARAGDLTTFLNRRLQLAPFLGSRTLPCAPPSTPSPPGSGAGDGLGAGGERARVAGRGNRSRAAAGGAGDGEEMGPLSPGAGTACPRGPAPLARKLRVCRLPQSWRLLPGTRDTKRGPALPHLPPDRLSGQEVCAPLPLTIAGHICGCQESSCLGKLKIPSS